LLFALTASLLFPLTKSDAARAPQPPPPQETPAGSPARAALPNYDKRLEGRGEFTDVDLNSSASRQRDAAKSGNAARLARAAAFDNFRAGLRPEKAQNLRAEVNEAGAMKNFFIDGASLSEPEWDIPDNIARKYLKRNPALFALSDANVDDLKLEKEDNTRGTIFLDYAQLVGGIKVFEGNVKVVVSPNGEVLSVREGFIVTNQKVKLKPALDEAQGIARAFEHAGRTVSPSFKETHGRASQSEFSRFSNPLSSNFEEVLSELNVVRIGDASHLAWHVYAEVGPEEWYELLVDAHTGELLLRSNLYVHQAQGTVYTEAPDKGARQLVSFVGDTAINTSAGWMGTSTVTTGNNVEAYLDTNADNAPDANNGTGLSNGHAFASNQNFTFPFSTTVDPRTQQAAVVTNLFYYNNIMHDFSYNLGFTETARNFQTNNYGRGGIGNDSVRAEAQDGSGTNNANFATPPDGQRPRMQQYLFTAPSPDRDSSVDGDVVFHEYGHGISNRLIGNGSTALQGTQSGAMGEGWSDYWAITINGDGLVGEYSTGNTTAGIRRAAYTVPANTIHDSYADVGNQGFSVHNDGEVWAATLWDLRTTLGAPTTDLLVLNGMKFTPTRPSFLNARDGILQADQSLNGGANRCAIWTVFARHGMGVSAVGNDGTTHVAASDLPGDCGGTCSYNISPTSSSQPAGGGTGSVSVTATAGCSWTAVSNATFITITSGSSGTGNGTVNFTVSANTGTSSRTGTLTIAGLTHTVTQAGTTGGTELIINPGFESGTSPWIVSGQVTRSTGAYPHSGVAYMIINGVNSTSGTLYQTVTIPSGGASLNFWLNITTSEAAGDPVFDRLFIEVRSTSGTLLGTLATFSNQNSGTAGVYVLRGPYNLSSWAGQTVRIQFRGTNDITLPTSFRVDDVSVK